MSLCTHCQHNFENVLAILARMSSSLSVLRAPAYRAYDARLPITVRLDGTLFRTGHALGGRLQWNRVLFGRGVVKKSEERLHHLKRLLATLRSTDYVVSCCELGKAHRPTVVAFLALARPCLSRSMSIFDGNKLRSGVTVQ